MNPIQLFEYKHKQVRTLSIEGDPWFVAKDVCDILDLKDVSKAVEKLENDEKLIRKLFVSGQDRDIWTISLPGFFSLVSHSYKPVAKPFQRWVNHEVLPQISKTGSFMSENAITEILSKVLDFVDKRFEILEQKINRSLEFNDEYIEPNEPVPEMSYRSKLNHHIRTYCRIHNYKDYQYEGAWNSFYLHFYYRYKTDVRRIAENQQRKGQPLKALDVIEDKGMMKQAYNLAVLLFPLPKYSMAG